MTFNLRTNLFGMIVLPEPCWETARLTTIQDSLAVLSTKDGETWTWVRRDASWSVAFKTKIGQDLGGAQSKLVDFNGTFGIVGMEMCAQSIQLLGMSTSYEEKQPSFLEGIKTGEITQLH
ncbi:unnamed protein product [Lactuca saligna]|uniref:Uncharacterized protein n=1 Tax=Lactuca saligna TaxID=75948 RepID=A0AA35VAW7_LACSI|nr:unnamed protein product [Lactuca saligna]